MSDVQSKGSAKLAATGAVVCLFLCLVGMLGTVPALTIGGRTENGISQNQRAHYGQLELNTATREDFLALPDIGEKRADAIVAYRENEGPFVAVTQLAEVPGIGDTLYQRLAPYLYVKQEEQSG